MFSSTKLIFSGVLKHFVEIDRKLLFWVKKATISERSLELLGDFFFSKKYEKAQILRKCFDLMETNIFGQTSEAG